MPAPDTKTIDDILTRAAVIPVLVIDDLSRAVELGRALVAGGLPVLEITLRTEVALEAIRRMASEIEGAIVGVGTVVESDQLEASVKAGARFAVSPGLTPRLAEAAADAPIPLLPGAMTPSEIMQAREWGYRRLKLFPASIAGGVGMLKALSGPLPDLRFCPTGGVKPAQLSDYLRLPNVVCVGGSWVAPREAVAAGDWAHITRLASEAVSEAARIRGAE
ncbi:bifunctional 4-hydroxy-2-oxoglutarate aldolase/2-dehydro-3-deoxy-phosphogluconate aldolase [Haliangium ochraceum]|uniref:2-dehydro-3-deoxy-phosphogluconate aldolase n=1 Tax=Haliangium ochraceum (strain DSM 14365 / JCM 11303 / SMP-2) TaxID=502025 RepID=D0LNL8_HALO1|nr:bifunctional 4-hydroxy-2-oxoglutarate aldolase/2-dehydro-3-deoxy-phosphogluconate aldolase [Haliangium ochraceum]ACY16923.1 2-dehydro-3-deoxyphosphogluconate aldolase/4- hydroxy-2-oxoglutarate aldolase [Haliangium ochraceum DSM 14365]